MANPVPTLTTARLILCPLTLDDAPAVQAIFPQWEIVRFLANRVPWPYPSDGALTYISDAVLPAVARGTEWYWSIRRKAAAEQLIGVIALMDKAAENRSFWLDPAWQRQGLMSEACAAVTDYWFDVLDRPVLRVSKAIDNAASRRISERDGMRVIATEERDYVGGRFLSETWEISCAAWRERRPQARAGHGAKR